MPKTPNQMKYPLINYLSSNTLQFECCFASVVSSSSLHSSPKEKMDRDLKLFMLHSAVLLLSVHSGEHISPKTIEPGDS